MIELKNICKSYDRLNFALDDVSLTVNKGEIFGIIGPSGAGKSTLIRVVNLLERPTSGEVIVDGKNLLQLNAKALRAARRNMGMVFQHFNLLSNRTVFENVALPLRLINADKTTIKTRVQELLQLVGLSEKADLYPASLSGGQKQRVAIARALVTNPHVLLCDEMTSALDPQTTHEILDLLQNINQKLQVTVLLITHEMSVIKQVADRVAVIAEGKIIECGKTMDVFSEPKQLITKQLVGKSLHLQEVPKALQKVLRNTYSDGAATVLQIEFIGKTAEQPIVSRIIKKYDVMVNILQANLEYVHGDVIGVMVVGLLAGESVIESIIQELTTQHIRAEILGFVPGGSI